MVILQSVLDANLYVKGVVGLRDLLTFIGSYSWYFSIWNNSILHQFPQKKYIIWNVGSLNHWHLMTGISMIIMLVLYVLCLTITLYRNQSLLQIGSFSFWTNLGQTKPINYRINADQYCFYNIPIGTMNE